MAGHIASYSCGKDVPQASLQSKSNSSTESTRKDTNKKYFTERKDQRDKIPNEQRKSLHACVNQPLDSADTATSCTPNVGRKSQNQT